MLVSPKWQTMWMGSQHCSKTTLNVPVPSQQAKNLLEDLRASCSSPNKAVQLEALKCWGAWINNQNQEDWKLNTVCYTAVRPLLTKKLQPLQKDADICRLRFSLMWALLRKVQNIMQLEGPQYILEVFLQSCLNWLSSCTGDGGEEVTELTFQLLLALFSADDGVNIRDEEMFQPLSADIFKMSRVFNRLADKFLNVFVYWKKAQDKNVLLKLWTHFLGNCELSSEHMAVPLWHKVFKLVGQICSEKSEPVKERLGLLHGCATTLKSVLSSSKFLDYGSLLLTPCEALFKKLMELCCSDCEEFYDWEMFVHGLEVAKVLSVESVAIAGYGLCISVLNLLDEFSLRSLYWGVWCGLVHCYESLLSKMDKNRLAKVEMSFYRKLRGVAINFDLDKSSVGEECVVEVEKCIRVLNVCLCACRSSGVKTEKEVETEESVEARGKSLEKPQGVDRPPDEVSGQLVPKRASPCLGLGKFSAWPKAKRPHLRIVNVNFDLVRGILNTVKFSCAKPLLDGTYLVRFIDLRVCDPKTEAKDFSLLSKSSHKRKVIGKTLRANVSENVYKKSITYHEEKSEKDEEEEKHVPKTRSQKRAKEEEIRKEIENQKRKTRKSFEIRVQEIVQKNKERKTEKNCRKSPVIQLREKRKKKVEGRKTETSERKAKNQNKGRQSPNLENYFKVITKKSGYGEKEEKQKGRGKKKKKGEGEKEEVNWKQTSLVSMMIQGKDTSKGGVRTRSKEKEVAEGRTKTKAIEGSPLAKLSPFKEVFHDHEYARMELRDLRALERVIVNKGELEKKTAESVKMSEVPEKTEETNAEVKKPKSKRTKPREGIRKSKRLSLSTSESEPRKSEEEIIEGEANKLATPENSSVVEIKTEIASKECNRLEDPSEVESVPEVAAAESLSKSCSPEEENASQMGTTEIEELKNSPEEVKPNPVEEAKVEEVADEVKEEVSSGVQSPTNLYEAEEFPEMGSTPRRGKKRFRILDSLKPSKKVHLEDPQEKLALEVEKENLEEAFSPTKEEKSLKTSPKAMNGMISSRALRMIALVPESTRSQMHWETSPKVEVKKKGPNVDKNSRASKMLALLSGNVVTGFVEAEDFKVEEVKSAGELATPPAIRTPSSSLKSPRTVKQRRSIRFDDTKNETVVYETDTPPSQVLEGKEKCRRIRLPEVNSPVHSLPQFTTAK